MQQELIELLEKLLNWYDYIGSDSYYAKDTGKLTEEAEALIKKAKNNAPAQEVGLTDELEQLGHIANGIRICGVHDKRFVAQRIDDIIAALRAKGQ